MRVDGGMVWVAIIGGILLVSLLASLVGSISRQLSRPRAPQDPDLRQAAAAFAKLRYLGPRGYRRRS